MPALPPVPAASASTATSAPAAPASNADRAEAGRQFEAIMLERLLAAARPPATGPEGDWRAMADRSVADSLSRQSPLGLAALIERTTR